MTNNFIRITQLFIILAMIAFTALVFTRMGYASAPSGLPATVATSTAFAINSQVSTTLFATSTCASRIISTKTNAVTLTFSDYAGQSPSGTFGHVQAASTTVAYDSGQYGCGLVKAYAFGADTLTITETR